MAVFFKLYHKMYEKPLLFKVNCFLIRTGVEKEIAYYFKTRKRESNTTIDLESKEFFEKHLAEIEYNTNLLADEKSKEIYKTLIEYRIKKAPLKKEIYSLDNQYFVNDIISISNQEVFVDCGAFVGDTINNLLIVAKKENKEIKRVVAFEPESENYKLLKKYYSGEKRIIPIEAGVSDIEKEVVLVGESTYARIATNGHGKIVKLRSIDNTQECQDATYIKMDIEGAEMDALRGAVETIKRNKPKLAICIYHGNDDMIRIIPFIHEVNPSYRLYIRHHSRDVSETVLYAIPT